MQSGERQVLLSSHFSGLRKKVCDAIRHAWESPVTPGRRMLRSYSGAVYVPADRLCAEAKMKLMDLLVPPCLELAYCTCEDVAALGRDLYLDLIAAELSLFGSLNAVRCKPGGCGFALVVSVPPAWMIVCARCRGVLRWSAPLLMPWMASLCVVAQC